ncbi:branched-chain amino acid aminotransferase [uncultured Pseudoramibacter sp.]|uniref:branched-chain amino acid aminotransferase n=1 Tax=uncultured Pseudoramibacter sp. TaxID=1623493 RepID=UPI0025E58EAC|nr:branched-chain amino acid aminotransferase [uncultured Pseudoramibacter sp.]
MDIKFVKAKTLKEKPDQSNLPFGRIFTDYMFTMDYDPENGWHNATIEPYGPISLDPSACVFHYAQEVFEGTKAYKTPDGHVQLFRPQENFARLNRSAKRLCIPPIDEDFALEALKKLVEIEKDWIPTAPGTSLYIRPFIFATENYIGVHVSSTYKFFIILCPVGSYYEDGLKPAVMHIEQVYARTVSGGTGEAKCGGNYAGSLAATEKANEEGYEETLWLDGATRKNIEEVGSCNIMFKIDGKFVTPKLTGTILPGITRKSIIQLLKSWGETVEERILPIQELLDDYHAGKVEEVFGMGTAAVVAPIGKLNYAGEDMVFNNDEIGPYAQKIYDTLVGIQHGTVEDPFNWVVKVC